MTQFVGYQINESGDEAVPIAVGDTKQACMSLLITRTLGAGISVGAVEVQQRDDIPADAFKQLGTLLDQFFTERGQT